CVLCTSYTLTTSSTTQLYTLSLHDALPIYERLVVHVPCVAHGIHDLEVDLPDPPDQLERPREVIGQVCVTRSLEVERRPGPLSRPDLGEPHVRPVPLEVGEHGGEGFTRSRVPNLLHFLRWAVEDFPGIDVGPE